MPPSLPNQQGSRSGLITALVVFVILFLVSTFYAFSFYQKFEKEELAHNQTRESNREVITDLSSPDFVAAKEAAKTRGTGGAFELKVLETQDLSRALIGQTFPTDQTLKTTRSAITQASKILADGGVQPKDRGLEIGETEPVIAGLLRYAQAYVTLDGEKKAVQSKIQDLQAEQQKLIQQQTAATAAKDEEIKKLQGDVQAESGKVEGNRKTNEDAVTQLTSQTSQQIKALSDTLASQTTAVAAKEQEIARLRTELNRVIGALAPFRVNAKENIVRKPDGFLTRVTADGYCYINCGLNDGVTVGLTFEVYDKLKGIPPLGDGMSEPEAATTARKTLDASSVTSAAAVRAGSSTSSASLDSELPKGKGSIEIVSVGPGHTSQCRVVRSEPGMTLAEGDIIGNLIYDRDRKYTFGIYGDFDLDGNNVPTTSDTAVIKRLCEQWGGKVVIIGKPEDVLVNLDFIVMGVEPKSPPGDPSDPEIANLLQKYKANFDAYQSIRGRSAELHVPIMNQNRFLCYIGYFDQRTR